MRAGQATAVARGLLWLLFAGTASAHVGFHGGTTVRLYRERTELSLNLRPDAAEMLLPEQQSFPDDSEDTSKDLRVFKERALHLYEVTTAAGVVEPQKAEVTQAADESFLFVIEYPPVTFPFRIRAVFAKDFGGDLQVPLSVFDLRENPRAADPAPIAGAILSSDNTALEVAEPGIVQTAPSPAQTTASGTPPTFRQFLRLGVEHILTGYDHLLFLLGLLVVCHRVKPMLTIITAFTLAHSLTLALAALDLVHVSGRIVEPMIAASIVFVGVENLILDEATKGRAWVAFGFGLIHGLGFASVLREIGLGAGGSPIALPLLSFNLGVEIGQICVAALVLPLFWQIRRISPLQPYVTPAVSVAVVLAGSFWLVERLWP